jgi:hypothetical protein
VLVVRTKAHASLAREREKRILWKKEKLTDDNDTSHKLESEKLNEKLNVHHNLPLSIQWISKKKKEDRKSNNKHNNRIHPLCIR